jgi:glutaminyl-tRNA synthetase
MRDRIVMFSLLSVARPIAVHSRPFRVAPVPAAQLLRPQKQLRPIARGLKMKGSSPANSAVMERENFLGKIMEGDLASGKHTSIVTRFPPEPNGYLHIGHAKSICVNFGLGEQYGGATFLRFDDTNPEKEEQEYIDAIQRDVRWLGFDWKEDDRLTYASKYFDRFHEFAILLIKEGKAYVESLTAEEMREYRGTLTAPGRDSPYRERSVDENLALFAQMTAGDVADGEAVLRLKIDMTAANMNMRDPTIYRVKRDADHPQTRKRWKVYPMYDYAHVLSDAFEGITHSLCTLEFADHRPLYEWILANLPVPAQPRQIEVRRQHSSRVPPISPKAHHLLSVSSPVMPSPCWRPSVLSAQPAVLRRVKAEADQTCDRGTRGRLG